MMHDKNMTIEGAREKRCLMAIPAQGTETKLGVWRPLSHLLGYVTGGRPWCPSTGEGRVGALIVM
jgi:hypothetical protein